MKTYRVVVLMIASCLLVSFSAAQQFKQPPASYADLKQEAERLFEQHSYANTLDLYARVPLDELPVNEQRWVRFRIADASWRSLAATQQHDSTLQDRAREQLEAIIDETKRQEDRDELWAMANESLADFWWTQQNLQNWGAAWPLYQNALDLWAGSSDLEAARARYLSIVWRMCEPASMRGSYGYWHSNVPIDVLDNALQIATSPHDRSRAHFHLATTLRHQSGDWRRARRIAHEFEGALEVGKSADFYDDALFYYGQWLMNDGRPVLRDNGQWTREQDYVSALAVFQRLIREFRKGETPHYDQAQEAIKNITAAVVDVSVSNIFLPGSEIQYSLNWRNVKQVELTLHQIDLTRDVNIKPTEDGPGNWQHRIDLAAAEKVRTWTIDTEDKDDYRPGQLTNRIEPPLPIGAYLLTATAGGVSSRTVVFVTDAALILKTSTDQVLAFACDALTSAPIADATVRIWRYTYDERTWNATFITRETDAQGLCVLKKSDFPNARNNRNVHYFAALQADARQAFANTYGERWSHDRNWRIYVFTDRAAYRPNETVNWKLIARAPSAEGYTTPANQTIEYEINDPQGSKVAEGKAVLNEFGSAWGTVEVTETMPLGEYHVTYWSNGRAEHIGHATLFRLEEYKLPEFQVSIKTPQHDGRPKAFMLGETVTVDIQADYYFGGPVANANVEVVVHQNPHYRLWAPPREYPWLYNDANFGRWWGGDSGQVIKRDTIRTNAEGKATLTFETPAHSQQDFSYRIEARVTDASRREIVASESVRVTRQRYYVHPRATNNLHRPGDKVTIEFNAIDANDQPVQTQGQVKVTREEWMEIWIDPNGTEVTGHELENIQRDIRTFPPLPRPGMPPWRLKHRGYKSEEILTTIVKLDEKGQAEFTFTSERIGFYRIAWFSKDEDTPIGPMPITAETMVWVADNNVTRLGYRSGGLEIIADKDTFRAGQTAPVMISTPTNDRYVLFSVEGNELYSYQVVHVTGNVKLIHVPIDHRHVPNVFLQAAMAHNGQLHHTQQAITVPPVEQYLTIDVKSDREQYQPGEEGTLTVTATDHLGKPVSAEIALAVVDEAVTYIQQDYAGDPREFFFDRHQQHAVNTGSTFQQQLYIKLSKVELDKEANNAIDDLRADYDDGEVENERLEWQTGTRARDSMRRNVVAEGSEMMLGMPVSKAEANYSLTPAPPAGMGGGGGAAPEPNVVVRSDFRSTLFWQPTIVTDESGEATISLKYADSLTTWKATARAAGTGQQFGIGTAATRTKMPLIARLQSPRFFLVGDSVTVSGVLNNNTDQDMVVRTSLEADGLSIEGNAAATTTVPAQGEARVDWRIEVQVAGNAKLKLTARGEQFADAMERNFIVYEHGVEKFVAKSGKVRGNDVTVQLDLPAERKHESTALAVQITPSMAVTMLDALPYLIDYPYGCTEQTMSRFLPAAITAKTLNDLGLKPETVMNNIFGGIEQAHVAKTQPKGKKELTKLDEMTQAGLDRLYSFQRGDGGWGWWKEGDADHFMTAYVLWGMCIARDAGLEVRQDVMDRAANFLDKEIVERETEHDLQAWLLHALASYHHSMKRDAIGEFQAKALANLWDNRDRLNSYTRALLALSAHGYDDHAKAKTLVENLQNGVKRDDRPDASVIIKGVENQNDAVIGTAHWGEDGIRWRWSEGGVEATAFALKALLTIDPKNPLVEPVTNWLVKNRRGAQWSNTRDTAIVVLAMNEYLKVSGELSPNMEYELLVNGTSVATRKLTAEDALSAPSRYLIDASLIRNGVNDIRIMRKAGEGAIYFSAEATYFSLEEPIAPAGNEIFVRREYYRLVPRPTLLKGYVYDRVPLSDGGTINSGERVEVVLTIEGKNHYEYLVFEDLKPAGFEAVAVRSGEWLNAREMKLGAVERTFGTGGKSVQAVQDEQAHGDPADYTGRARGVYQELRDRKVAMFIDKLPEGVWEIRYDLRAETPGRFHALPVLGHAMYVPEIRANSAEVRVTVLDKTAD